jgi:hypothetical protein
VLTASHVQPTVQARQESVRENRKWVRFHDLISDNFRVISPRTFWVMTGTRDRRKISILSNATAIAFNFAD